MKQMLCNALNIKSAPKVIWLYFMIFVAGMCHKAVTCNALCEQFKMADSRKLIDVKQHFSFVNESIHNQRIALLDWKNSKFL